MIRFTKNLFLLTSLSIYVLACQTNDPKDQEPLLRELVPKLAINNWQDSIYIKYTQSLETHKGNLLITDFTGSRILKLDSSYQMIQIIGRKGRGPREIVRAAYVKVQHDIYYLLDRGNKWLNTFKDDGAHRKVIRFEESISTLGKFAVDPTGNIYISADSEEHLYTKFDKDGRVVLRFGMSGSDLPSYLPTYADLSHLLMLGDDKLLTVKISQPIIDVYDLEGNLLEHYDFSSHPLFYNVQEAIKAEYQAHGDPTYLYVPLVKDVCIWQNYLLALCSAPPLGAKAEDGYPSKLYLFDIENEMEIIEIITLNENSTENDGRGFGAIGIFPKTQPELVGFDWFAQTLYVYDWESPGRR